MRRYPAFAIALAMLCMALPARAHDSWFNEAPSGAKGGLLLELGTGTRFPLREFTQTPQSVASATCVDGAGAATDLSPGDQHAHWLDLRVEPSPDGGAAPLSCAAELAPVRIELAAPIVAIYFADIHASSAVRQAWAAQSARGIGWSERYRKFARIELRGSAKASAAQRLAARRPNGRGLEIVVIGDAPITTAAITQFQLLSEGRPLAGQPVELVSERSPLGVWQLTDAQGRLRHRPPFSGNWLLRTVDLQPPARAGGDWESRFATLAFDVP